MSIFHSLLPSLFIQGRVSDPKRQSKYEPGLVEKRSEDCENGPDDKFKAKNSMFRSFQEDTHKHETDNIVASMEGLWSLE